MPGRPPTSDPRDEAGAVVEQAWQDHRRHLLDIGFRMLGDVGEAEDVVQEAFARLVRADVAAVDDPGGWLVVVVSRLCLDRLRSGRRHPTSPDPSVGERPDPTPSPADRVTLDDSIRMALHRVLERLTPAERTAFLLHDVFRYPFETIGEIVGRTPAACRQLASRARRTIGADAGARSLAVEPAEQRRVTERFIAACSGGDLEGLLAVLDPDVAGATDVGGAVGTRSAAGRDAVAATLLQYLGPGSSTTLLSLPAGGRAHVLALRGDRVVTLLTLTLRHDRVHHIDGVVDPVKLAPLQRVLGT